MITSHKITLFNKVYNKETAKAEYQSRKMRAYMVVDSMTQGGQGINSKVKQAKVFISIPIYGKDYRSPLTYDKLEDKSGIYTLAQGDKICRGWVDTFEGLEAYSIEQVEIYDTGKLAHFVVIAK